MSRPESFIQHRRDTAEIFMSDTGCTDKDVATLVDFLIANPNAVTHVYLNRNILTDKTGVKLARFVAESTTVEVLRLDQNLLSARTFLVMAHALAYNASLRVLELGFDVKEIPFHVLGAFTCALRINPRRPKGSAWVLSTRWNDFTRLEGLAMRARPPSMLVQVAFASDLDFEK